MMVIQTLSIKKINTLKLIAAIGICLLTGVISSLLSMKWMYPWFAGINKPQWNPPDNIFGPVWTILYVLMGIALYLIWKSSPSSKQKKNAELLFAFQLFLNFWWSIVFFRFHSPEFALLIILMMDLFIIITIFQFAKISRTASWLMVPYISWVCFASMLNYSIYSLN